MKVIKKRFFSIILAVSMIITVLLPQTFSFAEEVDATADSNEYVSAESTSIRDDAAALVSALGIMNGKENGDFAPDDLLTRAEMCAITLRFMGSAGMYDSTAGTISYTDVPDDHWAKGDINGASALGLIQGNGDGSFYPDQELTGAQAVKMLVCALGYESEAEQKGGFPSGYLSVANQLRLMRKVDLSGNIETPVPRWKIAVLIMNALDAKVMELKIEGTKKVYKAEETALERFHDVEKKSGTVTAVYNSSINKADLAKNEIMIDDERYITELDAEGFLGMYVDFYCTIEESGDDSRVIAILPKLKTVNQTEIDIENIDSLKVDSNLNISIRYFRSSDSGSTTSINLEQPAIMYNGKQETFGTAAEAQTFLDEHMKQGSLTCMKNSAGSSGDVLFVNNYEAYVVANVFPDSMHIDYCVYSVGKTDVATLDLSDENVSDREVFIYDETGAEIDISQLAANDVIMVYASTDGSLYKIYQSKKQVTGIIGAVGQVSDTDADKPEWEPEPEVTPYYEELSEIDMDGFTTTCDDYNATGAIWGLAGTKTVGDTTYTLKTDGGTDPWIVGRWSMFLDMQGENKDAMNNDTPSIIKNNKLFRLNRQYTWAQNWSISGTPSSKAGVYINALNPSDVAIGDRIKVTAWVYVDELCAGYPGSTTPPVTDGVDQNQDVNVRMWLMNPWVSVSNPGYNPGDPGNAEEAYVGKIPANTWTPIFFEYTVNETNSAVYNVRIDNYTQSGSYPLNMYLAGVKAERYVDPRGNQNPNLAPRPEIPLDNTEYEITIDGKAYKQAAGFPSSLLELGNSVTLLLDLNDRIVGFTRSLSTEGYGLLINAWIDEDEGEPALWVKILKPDNVLETYKVRNKVKAYDGTGVKTIPAVSLVTDEPSNPMTDWHLWSTNNVENFECVDRTWLTDEQRSRAANCKMVYYRTNSTGQITTILVPSMPENHPEAKIKMVRNFGAKEGEKKYLFQQNWPRWIMNGSYYDFTELTYCYEGNAVWYNVWSEDYDDNDYQAGDGGTFWNDNLCNGRTWNHAQLYRIPGSKTVDFIVMNPHKVFDGRGGRTVVVVDSMEQTEDGYILNGYATGASLQLWNPRVRYKIKNDLRVFENIWVSSLGEDSERLTWDNIAYYEGATPYNVSYESDVMGNRNTPYVDASSFEKGDALIVIVENNEITYIEPVLRRSVGLTSSYCKDVTVSTTGAFDKDSSLTYGEITAVDSKTGVITISGWGWGRPDEPISSVKAGYVAATSSIERFTVDWYPYGPIALWDESNRQFRSATWGDYEVGDKLLVVGNMDSDPYNSRPILYKTKKQSKE